MKHSARVLSAEQLESQTAQSQDSRNVLVEIDRVSSCQRCARGQGCGSNIFKSSGAAVQLYCRSELKVQQHQHVIVEFDDGDSRWLLLIVAAYGLPLAGMIFATAVFSWLRPETELLVALAAAAGLAGGIFAWRRVAGQLSRKLESSLCLQTGRIVAISEP